MKLSFGKSILSFALISALLFPANFAITHAKKPKGSRRSTHRYAPYRAPPSIISRSGNNPASADTSQAPGPSNRQASTTGNSNLSHSSRSSTDSTNSDSSESDMHAWNYEPTTQNRENEQFIQVFEKVKLYATKKQQVVIFTNELADAKNSGQKNLEKEKSNLAKAVEDLDSLEKEGGKPNEVEAEAFFNAVPSNIGDEISYLFSDD